MIKAKITTVDGKVQLVRQGGNELVVERGRMQVEPGRFAEHTAHSWLLDGQHFLAAKVSSRVTVHFERGDLRSQTFGPYEAVWLVDGMILDGLDEEVPLAQYHHDTREWLCPRDGKRYTRVVFAEA